MSEIEDPIWGRNPPHQPGEGLPLSRLEVREPAACEADIPPRDYVVPGFLQRGTLMELIGPGGAGKGQLVVAWCVALALGQPFGGFRPASARRTLLVSVEDGLEEQDMRIHAALRFFGAQRGDLGGRLRIACPTGAGTLFESAADGGVRATHVLAQLREEIACHKPDLLTLDPLAELHDGNENDNIGVRLLGSGLRELARTSGLGMILVHHVKKGVPTPGNMDAGRGAGSMSALCRAGLTLFPMTPDEATRFGISNPDFFVRLDGAKANNDPKVPTEWFQRMPITLDNGSIVSRCEPWTPPSDAVRPDVIPVLLAEIKAGDNGKPWTRRLGRYDRSIAKAFARQGITTRQGQEAALAALFEAGVMEATWRRGNRMLADGLRHPDGSPSVRWEAA